MNFRQLRYFCEVVDAGTLARAAERLFVAPTAISMQISQLEGSVGGALFDRSAKPMALTPLGHYFLPRARELLRDGQRLEEDTRDMASGRLGWLSIGFVRSLLYSVLPLAIRSFRERFPDIKLELVELLSEHQTSALRQRRIHIGLSRFAREAEPPNDLRHTLLFDDPYVAAVPSSNALAKAPATTLAALADLPFIAFPKDPASSYASQVMSILHSADLRPRVAHEAIEIHTALGLVSAGLGFTIVGASVATRGPADVTFVELPEVNKTTQVVAVTREDESSELVTSMLDTLRSVRSQPAQMLKRSAPAGSSAKAKQSAGDHTLGVAVRQARSKGIRR
jgi:LysR family transcriptional regulator, benzoate and cis,cis-muconate-responsive activator of ben and cat genes